MLQMPSSPTYSRSKGFRPRLGIQLLLLPPLVPYCECDLGDESICNINGSGGISSGDEYSFLREEVDKDQNSRIAARRGELLDKIHSYCMLKSFWYWLRCLETR